MEITEAINKRRTIRNFRPDPLPRGIIQDLIDSAIMAPSSLNSQPWNFYVVTGEKRVELARIISKTTLFIKDILPDLSAEKIDFFCNFVQELGGAPSIIVMTTPFTEDKYNKEIQWLSCGCALQNLLLKAWGDGVGAVVLTIALWVEKEIKQSLGIKKDEIVAVVPIGYPAEAPEAPSRERHVVSWVGF